ncbi:hypothetical protein Btru_056241 [Bulinus truncatus]|nr:hypothetical protein Btru_056241 [Bulinus truncatus]
MVAVDKHDLTACSFLLEQGADPNITRSFDGDFTALSLACRFKNPEILRVLIRNGAIFSCENGLKALETAVAYKFFEDIKVGENDSKRYPTAITFAYIDNRIDPVQQLLMRKVSVEKSLLNTEDYNLIQMLITAGADLNYTDECGRTALHWAIKRKQMKTVQLLVESKANIEVKDLEGNTALLCSISRSHEITQYLIQSGSCVNCVNLKGETPLLLAVKLDTFDTFKLLIENGSDIRVFNETGKSILNYPIERNQNNIVDYLIQLKIDVNVLTEVNEYPLMLAIDKMNIDIIKLLTDAGADVNQKDLLENSALIRALTQRRCSEMVTLLISAGADVNCVNEEQVPALILAMEQRNLKVVKLFLNHGVNVNVKNKKRETALMIAADMNEKEIVEMLIETGANVDETDSDGNSVMMRIILKQPNKYSSSFISHTYKKLNQCDQDVLELLKLLIQSKADLNNVNHVKDSLLNIALKKRFEDVALLLIQNGADTYISGSECKPPLIVSAGKFSTKLVEEIIKTGVDVNATDRNGDTALIKLVDRVNKGIYARNLTENDILIVAHLLVHNGANANHLNSNKQSAFCIAVKSDITSIAKYLIEVGADVNQCDRRSQCPLLRSVHRLNHDMLKTLLAAGANVNIVDKHGRNALIRVIIDKSSTHRNDMNESVFEIIKIASIRAGTCSSLTQFTSAPADISNATTISEHCL